VRELLRSLARSVIVVLACIAIPLAAHAADDPSLGTSPQRIRDSSRMALLGVLLMTGTQRAPSGQDPTLPRPKARSDW
jgi:hypothetical protein